MLKFHNLAKFLIISLLKLKIIYGCSKFEISVSEFISSFFLQFPIIIYTCEKIDIFLFFFFYFFFIVFIFFFFYPIQLMQGLTVGYLAASCQQAYFLYF